MLRRAVSWSKLVLGWLLRWAARLKPRRVPVVLQMNNVECGAACLAMVLNYHGRTTRISECRECCATGRDGVTAKTIAAAARSFQLRVKAYSLGLADFQYLPLPAIAHWNFDHFVVVERWYGSTVDVVDPAAGRRRLTAEEFDRGFTGVILLLEPGTHFERRQTPSPSLWGSYLRAMWQVPGTAGLLWQILGASLVLQVLGLVVPLVTQVLVDRVLPLHLTNILAVLALAAAVLVLAQLVANYLRAALLIYLQGRLDCQMMLGLFEHVLSLPFRFFQERTSGDLLMRLGSSMEIRSTLTTQTLSVLLDGTFVLAYLVILWFCDVWLGLLVLALGMFEVVLVLGTSRRLHGLMQRQLAAEADSQSYLTESLAGIATLKASGGEDRVLDHWSDLFFRELNVSVQKEHLEAVIETALLTLRSLAPLVLLSLGAYRVLDGTLSLGTMLALNALAMSFLSPLASLVSSGQQLQLVGAYLERIADVMEAEPEQHAGFVHNAPRLTGRIELRNVSFRYDRNSPWVLRNISLTIEPGEKVALVGRSGSGKSTLAKLLLGLYEPTQGQVLFDGIPLEQLNYRSLRSQFGVVLQEPFLFSGSIRQNIAGNDPSLSLEEVIEAAEAAAIHDEIAPMPMGYESLVAEGGTGISGGQRQRISIARALAHKPAVLLFDEATSHLDAVTERVVDQNLNALPATRIVIAHRLSTVRNADLILVLSDGALVEQGSHEALVEQDGVYRALAEPSEELRPARASE